MNIDMSSKNTKVKTTVKSQTASTPEPVKQSQPVQQTEPIVQKGGKKSTKQTETKPAEPVVVKQAEPVKEVQQTQKGGKKTVKQAEPAPAPVPEPTQKGGKKSTKKTESVAAKQVEPVQPAQPAQPVQSAQKGGKKATKQAEPVVQQGGKVEVDDDDEEQQAGSRLRYFKLIYNDEIQGRYCGKKPKQAANKAFSSIIKDMKKGGNQQGGVNVDINFSIRECTRNSKHKEYKYVGIRETLKEPVKVAINNEDGSVKEIVYNFHNKIQKAPKA